MYTTVSRLTVSRTPIFDQFLKYEKLSGQLRWDKGQDCCFSSTTASLYIRTVLFVFGFWRRVWTWKLMYNVRFNLLRWSKQELIYDNHSICVSFFLFKRLGRNKPNKQWLVWNENTECFDPRNKRKYKNKSKHSLIWRSPSPPEYLQSQGTAFI